MTEHHCEKWDLLMQEDSIEIDESGQIMGVYVDYDSDWSYTQLDNLQFEFCPYCGAKL